MKQRIIGIIKFKPDVWREFYMSAYYPPVIAAIVVLGSLSGLEYYFNFVNTALVIGALLICPSIKPVMITLMTYVYQISLVNSPFYPGYSDYYVSAWRLPVSIIIIVLVVSAFVFYIIKNKIYKRISLKKTPYLAPMLAFSVALLLNGAFSGGWKLSNLLFGASHIIVYLVVFLLFYYGLEGEKSDELVKYFIYLSLLIVGILGCEMLHLFLTVDNVFVDGSINKVAVALGWGIWNLVAVSSAVLIPACFLGMEKCRYPWIYFAAATLAYLISILTMSRNALIFSSITYSACVIIFSFVGKNKKAMRIVVLAGIASLLLVGTLFFDKISALLADYIERGFSDNGRFNLWSAALKNFIDSPIFGSGFYGLHVEGQAVFGPLPVMAHNTVLELLSATGVVGFGCYVWYRASTVKTFIKHPSLEKTMLGISILVILLESLLDNFVFNIYPMFYAMIALAIATHKEDMECRL